MATWDKLDDSNKNIANEPWSLYWSESKSGSKEFEEFLHDPLKECSAEMSGVDRTWTVQSNILNHEIGLLSDLVCKLALVDPVKKTVYLTLYKHPAD